MFILGFAWNTEVSFFSRDEHGWFQVAVQELRLQQGQKYNSLLIELYGDPLDQYCMSLKSEALTFVFFIATSYLIRTTMA